MKLARTKHILHNERSFKQTYRRRIRNFARRKRATKIERVSLFLWKCSLRSLHNTIVFSFLGMDSRFCGLRSRQIRQRHGAEHAEGVAEGGEARSTESRDSYVQLQNEAVQFGTGVKYIKRYDFISFDSSSLTPRSLLHVAGAWEHFISY